MLKLPQSHRILRPERRSGAGADDRGGQGGACRFIAGTGGRQARGRFRLVDGETEVLTRKAVEQHLLVMREASLRPREGRVRHPHNSGNGFSPKPPGLDVEAGVRKRSSIDSAAGQLLQSKGEFRCKCAAGIANGNYWYNYLLQGGKWLWDIAHRPAH